MANGTTVAGRYHLDTELATGGMGVVWSATDRLLDRQVAMKLLRPEVIGDPEALARFRAEARHAASLVHPGVTRVYDYGEEHDGAPVAWLVMELVDGEPVSALLAREGPLGSLQAVDLLIQAADALAAAHERGLVHRDVKPGNMLIGSGGKLKLTDFGIAHAVGSLPHDDDGQVRGTARYMSPEQAIGEVATPQSDVYSLAVVGYELLAGRPPFDGTAAEVARSHVRDAPAALPVAVPADLAALLRRAMAKDPGRRPADGAAFAAELRRLRDSGGSTQVMPVSAIAPVRQDTADAAAPLITAGRLVAERRRWRLGVAVAALIALLLLAGTLLLTANRAPRTGGEAPDTQPVASITTVSVATLSVDQAALVGRPLGEVADGLRAAGFVVTVMPPELAADRTAVVVGVQPSGTVPRGASLVVSVAPAPTTTVTAPPTTAQRDEGGKGKDKGKHNGGD